MLDSATASAAAQHFDIRQLFFFDISRIIIILNFIVAAYNYVQ